MGGGYFMDDGEGGRIGGISVKFAGYNRVKNQLRAAASAFSKETDPVMKRFVEDEALRMMDKPYPPKRPKQKYKRTFRLKRSFSFDYVRPGVWTVTNRVPYSYRVINKGTQGYYFVGRWWTLQDEMRENRLALSNELTAMLSNLMEMQRDN